MAVSKSAPRLKGPKMRAGAVLLAAALCAVVPCGARGGIGKDGDGAVPAGAYTHNTGAAELTVDDAYLGGNHYHALSGSDNLWRGFLGIQFEQTDSNVINGFPGDSGWGAVNDLDSLDSPLSVDVVQGYNHTRLAYRSSAYPKILVTENAYSGTANEHWIVVEYGITNSDTVPLTGGRAIYFYEGDLPVHFYYDDNSAWDYLTHTAWEYDYSGGDQIATGISWLGGAGTLYHGDFLDWWTEGTSETALCQIVTNPFWTGYLDSDVAVYLVVEIPFLGPGQQAEFPIAFVNGPDDSACLAAAEQAKSVYDSLFLGVAEHVSGQLTITRCRLLSNYPNPFTSSTTISYAIGQAGEEKEEARHTILSIYNVAGRLVRVLVEQKQQAGHYDVNWDGRDGFGREVGPGTYFCRLERQGYSEALNFVLLR